MNLRGNNDLNKLINQRETELRQLRQRKRNEIQMQKRKFALFENETQESNQNFQSEQMDEERDIPIETLMERILQNDESSFHKLNQQIKSDNIDFSISIYDNNYMQIFINNLKNENDSIKYLSVDIINSYISSFDDEILFTIDVVNKGIIQPLLELCLSNEIQMQMKALTILINIIIDCNRESFKYYEIFPHFNILNHFQYFIENYQECDENIRGFFIELFHSIILNNYVMPTSTYNDIVQILLNIVHNESERTFVCKAIVVLCAAFQRVECIELLTNENTCRIILSRMQESFEIKKRCFIYFGYVAYNEYYEPLHKIGLYDIITSYLNPQEDSYLMEKIVHVISNLATTRNEFLINEFLSHYYLQFTIDCIMNATYRSCLVSFSYILFNICDWIESGYQQLVGNIIQNNPNFILCVTIALRQMKLENINCFSFGLKKILNLFESFASSSDIVENFEQYGLDALLQDSLYVIDDENVKNKATYILNTYFNENDDYDDHSYEMYDL